MSTYGVEYPCTSYFNSGVFLIAGFTHSAFAFGYEASINKCPIDASLVPPGALITFIQKGLQYLEMEANLSNVSICTNSFSSSLPFSLQLLLIAFLTHALFKLVRLIQMGMRIFHFSSLLI